MIIHECIYNTNIILKVLLLIENNNSIRKNLDHSCAIKAVNANKRKTTPPIRVTAMRERGREKEKMSLDNEIGIQNRLL